MRTDIETVIGNYWVEVDSLAAGVTAENAGRLRSLLDVMPKIEDLYITYRRNLYEVQDLNAQIVAETDTRKKAFLVYDRRHYQSLNNILSAQVELLLFDLVPTVDPIA